MNNQKLTMNQTRRVLIEIARAENVPYSGLNKRVLIDRIQNYRDTVGTLYRENKGDLKALAKAEGIRGYGSLNKRNLIDTILYYRRVIKPHINDLSKLTRSELVRLARKEGLKVIGGKKTRVAQNIAINRVSSRPLKKLVEDVANSEVVEVAMSKRFKPEEIEGAFNGGYVRFRSKGVEEHQGMLSVEQYLHRTRHHIFKVIEEMVRRDNSWKIQLNVVILFRKRDGSDETEKPIWSSPPHTVMEGTDMEEVLDEMRTYLLQQYEMISNTMESSDYVFIRVVEMTYHCHRVDLNRGGSYIELPEWVKNKKCCINPKNEDDECFKWAVTVALHYEEIGNNPHRISKIRPYIDRYNWNDINFPTPSSQWKKFEKQNSDVALNVLVIDDDDEKEKKKIRQGYISKYNMERSKCVDLLIVQRGEKRHYVAIKSLSALLRGITSNHNGDFYCRNCLGSFASQGTLKLHIQACKDYDFCYVKMPEEGNNILKYQEGSKSIRVPFVIYADTELSLIHI